MDKFGLSFLTNQQQAKQQSESVMNYIQQSGQFSKVNADEFLNTVYYQLTSPETTPISKTMTLHVLKEITYQAEVRFFSVLSSHQLLQFLFTEAKTVDPKKDMNEKGAKKFINEPQAGKQYMQLLLELMHFWGDKFAKGKNSIPTKFKKNLADLKNSKIVFPNGYSLFDPNEYRSKSKRGKESPTLANSANFSSGSAPAITLKPIASIPLRPPGKLSNDIRFTKDKINIFLGELEDADDSDKIQNIIHTNHAYFQKQKAKYSSRGAQVQQDQQVQTDYFSIEHFLSEEQKFYLQYIPISDFSSYIAEIKILVQTLFQSKNSPKSRFPSAKVEQVKPLLAVSNNNQGRVTLKKLDSSELISSFYRKLQSRSKSPVGFAAIEKDLELSKEKTRKEFQNRSRSPKNNPGSGIGLRKKSTSGSNLQQSKIHPIFSNPPNISIRSKNYEGQVIPQSRSLKLSMQKIKIEQTHRRFKVSNFRDKNPLFENGEIQIGFKSQAVYDELTEFPFFLSLNIFIGNKTQDGIKDFQVSYKGESNLMLLGNPKNVDSIIPAGYQNKHDLMIVPIDVPFSLITMNISYKFKNEKISTCVVLPCSILKFAFYLRIDNNTFESNWRNSRKYKTNTFTLSKEFPPQTFNKFIHVMDLSSYRQFSKPGNDKDLELICSVILIQKFEAVLKINFRPNLEVVLQLGVMQKSNEAMEYFKLYLTTLELIMMEMGGSSF